MRKRVTFLMRGFRRTPGIVDIILQVAREFFYLNLLLQAKKFRNPINRERDENYYKNNGKNHPKR